MEAESRYEDIRCFNIYHSVSLKLQYPFKSQGTNYGAFGSHMTTLLVMQNSIAMTTGLVQTWGKKKKKDILSSQTILATENISPDSSNTCCFF